MELADASDGELVHRCRNGEARAWSVLVRRYERLVVTIPRRARLSEEQAADILQIAFTRLYEHLDRLQDPSRVRAWLVTTARNETLREIERARREPVASISVDALAAGDCPADDAQAAQEVSAHLAVPADWDNGEEELWHDLRLAVDRLEPRCRELIELLFLTEPEPSYAVVSERLGMPLGSIGPNRGRCLAHLRRLMEG